MSMVQNYKLLDVEGAVQLGATSQSVQRLALVDPCAIRHTVA